MKPTPLEFNTKIGSICTMAGMEMRDSGFDDGWGPSLAMGIAGRIVATNLVAMETCGIPQDLIEEWTDKLQETIIEEYDRLREMKR